MEFKILVFILATASCFALKDEVIGIGKTGEVEQVAVYAGIGTKVKLICEIEDSNLTSPYWSFKGEVFVADIGAACDKKKDKHDDEDKKEIFSNCDVEFDPEDSRVVLELDKVIRKEFGEYVCHNRGNKGDNLTFILEEIVSLTRRKDHRKIEESVTIYEGDNLNLHCKATGFNPKWHLVSWFKDDMNITDSLLHQTGLFRNFTKHNAFNYSGPAIEAHRGFYTCQVDLIDDPNLRLKISGADQYPVSFKVFVRVKEDNWRLPTYIFIGEVVLIGLFTAIVAKMEKKAEENPDGHYSDSDSDDEVQMVKSANGVSNNNSNGK